MAPCLRRMKGRYIRREKSIRVVLFKSNSFRQYMSRVWREVINLNGRPYELESHYVMTHSVAVHSTSKYCALENV